MKKALLYFSFLLPFVAGCGSKASCIQGIVVDSKTNEPISGASVQMSYEYTEQGSLKHQQPSALTDASGEFSFSAEEKHAGSVSIWTIYKTGYTEAFDIDRNNRGCDDATIKLTPLDGLVKLTVANEEGIHDSIYVEIFNKCDYRFHSFADGISYTDPFPLVLQQGEVYTQTFGSCIGDSVAIMWKFTKHGSWIDRDSFIVESADTTFSQITY